MSLYQRKAKKHRSIALGKQSVIPQQVQVSLQEAMGAAKEGLLALAVAVGIPTARPYDTALSKGVWSLAGAR